MRENWEMKKLSEVCKIRPPKSEARETLSANDMVSFVPMKSLGIDQKYFDVKDEKELSSVSSSYTYFKDNDVLLAKITPCFENGKLGIAKNLINGIGFGSSEYIVYRPSEKLLSEFLYYFLNQETFRKKGESQMTGAVGHKRIPKEFYEESQISIPPLEEQKQIVALLDKAFAAIDQAKTNIEKNIENAKELFQSKLNDIFSQQGDGWEEKTILELCDHKSQIVGGPFGSNLKVKDYKETGVPILRLQNIGKGYFIDKNIKYVDDQKAKELDYHSFVSGDIALAKLGIPIGKTCIIPEKFKYGIVTADVVRIRPNKENINYSFLKHFLNSQSAVQQLTDDITGATRPRVNMAEVRNLKLSVPSKEQQISLNNIIDRLETDINNVISNYEKKNLDLEELKKSLLQKAFSGELTQKEVHEVTP